MADDVKRLIELDKSSGKLELDENGHTRFIPSDAERALFESYLASELQQALIDWQPRWLKAADNIKSYRCAPMTIPDSGEAIVPSPVSRIPADQIIAWTFDTIMRPRPIFSVEPYFPAQFTVPVPPPQPGMPPVVIPCDAEEVARNLERGIEFKVRERLNFETALSKTILDCVSGASPSYIKVCADQRYHTFKQPKVKGVFLDTSDYEEKASEGEIVHFYPVSVFNALRPVNSDDEDIDADPWFAERTPYEPDDFRAKCYAGEFFLVKEEEIERLSASITDTYNPFAADVDATAGKVPQSRKQMVDVWEVLVRRWLKYVDPQDGQKKLKQVDLLVDFHLTEKRILCAWLNPYDHQRRYYVPFTQFEDGSSTVENLRYLQKLITHLTQAEVKNAFHANNFSYWWDPDSLVADYFEAGKKLGPGEGIPGKEGEDWGVVRVGAEHYSLLPSIQYFTSLTERVSNESAMKLGLEIPGRTPASTVSQVMDQSSMQQLMFLRRLSKQLAKVMRLYLLTVRQYQPMGETIPARDPKTKQIIELPFRFPVGDVLDNLRIALTAADEAMASEHDFEKLAMLKNILTQDAQFVAQVAGPMMNPQATPATVELFKKIIERDQELVNRIVSLTDTDEEEFDLTDQVEAIVKEQEAARQMAAMNPPPPPQPQIKISLAGKLTPQQEAIAAQQQGIGGPSAQGPVQGSGGVQGAGGPNQGGAPSPTGAQPPVPPPSGPPATHGVPPAQ